MARAAGSPLLGVVGARPNYMKMAPLVRALEEQAPDQPMVLVHTGQHYDLAMNDRLFADLALPAPDVNLGVGSGGHALQTAEVMRRFDPVLDRYRPAGVVVVGDVNSTLACALVAAKKGVRVAHVEAGLRSFDRSMPEEINRVLTDQLADLLFTTEASAAANLTREGIDAARIRFVGNVMIDSLLQHRARAPTVREVLRRNGVDPARLEPGQPYALATLHRPSNVDTRAALEASLAALCGVARRLSVVFAMHPRTRAKIEAFGLEDRLLDARIVVLAPQGYLETIGLMAEAAVVLTDSGGMQEETTALGVPCLTMRDNTERPITVEQGTNLLVGRDPARIAAKVDEILASGGKRGRLPALWDGHAAERIARELSAWLAGSESRACA